MNRYQPRWGRIVLAHIALLSFTLLLGTSSNTIAGQLKPQPVDSSIRIFPDGYNTQSSSTEGFPREDCVRQKAGLNSLTCTANDVKLAEITLPAGAPSTCLAGQEVTQKLNFNVKSTANIRYNFAFYTTTNPTANPLDGVPSGSNKECLIWVGEITSYGLPGNSQSVNGDMCTDVTKAQDAIFEEEEITFICQDTDGDSFVDLDYCATWDQNSDNFCSTGEGGIQSSLLPTPGAPSKCNCETITIPVTVLPSEPVLDVAINGTSSRPESEIYAGTDTYSFDLKITNPNTNTSLNITQLTDKFGDEYFNIPSSIPDTLPGSLGEDQVVLIKALDNDGTCLESGSETIAPGASYTCTVTYRWKSLALTNTNETSPVQEYKSNEFSVEWTYGGSPAEKAESSHSVAVSITDVPPMLTLSKLASPTSIPESGASGFDYIHYTVTFGNESGWDEIHIDGSDITDSMLEINSGGEPKNIGYIGCSVNGLYKGELSDCSYGLNMGTMYSTINAGDVYKNTITGIPTDEEGSSGDLMTAVATVNVDNVNPIVVLKKYVKAGLAPEDNPFDPSAYHDVSTTVGEFQVADITRAPVVTYLFVVSNNSFEDFKVIDFVDFAQAETFSLTTPTQAYDSNIADTTPVVDTCSDLVETTVTVGQSVACILSFKVMGDDDESVDNTAWVLVDDGDVGSGGQGFDTDAAMVLFTPGANSLELGLDLSATIEVSVTGSASNVEGINVDPYSDFVVLVPNPNTTEDYIEVPVLSGSFNDFIVSNINCSEHTIEPNEIYNCSFTVNPKGEFNTSVGLTVINNTLKVKGWDDDGVEQELSATITAVAK